jgi:uncharacterized protein YkwD
VPDGAPAIAAPLLAGAGLPAAPLAPATAAPPTLATTARSCPGARRRSGRRRASAVRCLVNRARARAGLRGFRSSAALARAARRHARDMARRRYFAHQRAGGPSLAGRARAAGWRGGVGEAIAWGCGARGTARATVRAWMASPPHRAILLSSARAVGIGFHRAGGCGGRTYWVADVG